MNYDKIKKLAEQAMEYSRDYVAECKHYGYYMEHDEFDVRFKEKFAELIVRECANICEIESETYKYSFTPSKARLATSTSKHCATMIKRHFGLNKDEP